LKPVGFGRIIRDEDGNVIDIILPDDDDEDEEEQEDEDEVKEFAPVEAKTDIVRGEWWTPNQTFPTRRRRR
jgi:nucleolar protein 16